MKLKPNSKYNTISAYVIVTFCICLLILVTLFKFSILRVIFGKLLKVTAPIIWGIVIAYLLSPIVNVFEKQLSKLICRKKKRPKPVRVLSITLTLLLFVASIYMIISSIVPEIIDSINNIFGNMQSYFDIIKNVVERNFEKLKRTNPELKDFIYREMDSIESVAMSMVNTLKPQLENILSKDGPIANITGSALSFIVGLKNFLLGIVISVYLLYSKEHFIGGIKKFICAVFNEKRSMRILYVGSVTNRVFLSFLSGKALDSLIIGMLCFVSMVCLGLPYTVLISVIVGLTNMIPFFGPIIGAIPTGFLILLVNPKKAFIFAIMILVLQQLDGNIIGPKILGNQLGVGAFWILFSIIIGGGFFGFIGMFLAVPVFAVIRSLVNEFVDTKLSRKMLSTNIDDYIVNVAEPPFVDTPPSEPETDDDDDEPPSEDDTAEGSDKAKEAPAQSQPPKPSKRSKKKR